MESNRVFLGIPLNPAVRAELARAAARISAAHHGLALVADRNYHLTLKFIGDVESARLPAVIEAFRGMRALAPIETSLTRCGAFPASGPPRVIWCGFSDPAARIAAAACAADAALSPLGFDAEPREYHPHVTLARSGRSSRPPKGLREFLADIKIEPVADRFETVILYRSLLEPAGSRYEPIAEYCLDGAAG